MAYLKPHVSKIDDGSTLIEWISNDWRFGISIEQDKKESSWYLIDKKDPDSIRGSGMLSEEFLNLFR